MHIVHIYKLEEERQGGEREEEESEEDWKAVASRNASCRGDTIPQTSRSYLLERNLYSGI